MDLHATSDLNERGDMGANKTWIQCAEASSGRQFPPKSNKKTIFPWNDSRLRLSE